MRAAVIPSANGHFTARSLARMYGMLANDGVIDGTRVIQAGRVRKMQEMIATTREISDTSTNSSSTSTREGIDGFGGGVQIFEMMNARGKHMKCKGIGHAGLGGSFAFCIPEKKFSFAFTCNQLNIFSVTRAALIVAVCSLFGMPVPITYGRFMKKAREGNFDSLDRAVAALSDQIDAELSLDDILRAMTA